MLPSNIKEYEFLRREVDSIKSCITSYIGIILGGSGAGFFALVFFQRNEKNIDEGVIAMVSVLSALIIISVYYILIYKFVSHNRYTGYLRLIGQEKSHNPVGNSIIAGTPLSQKDGYDIFGWEVCIANMLNWEKEDKDYSDPDHPYRRLEFDIPDKEHILAQKWTELKIHDPRLDKNSGFKSYLLLIRGLFRNDKSKSWKYPLYTSYIILIFALFFIISSVYFLSLEGIKWDYNTISIILLLVINLILWHISIKELYRIMNGSKTIDSFCWKFLSERVHLLNKYGIKPEYIISKKPIVKKKKE